MTVADWLVGASAIFLLYHWFAYPLLVHVVAGMSRAGAQQSNRETPSVSVLIPARNEEATIARKLRNSLELEYPGNRLEIVVGSDASTDKTDAVAESFRTSGVRLIRTRSHRGYAAVVNQLAAAASGELLLFTDSDVLLDAGAARELAEALADPRVGAACVVYGRTGRDGHPGEGLYDRYESWIKDNESRAGVMVGTYGAGVMVRQGGWAEMPDDTILGDMWMGTGVLANGLRVVQAARAFALGKTESPLGEFRRKVRIGRGSTQVMLRRPTLYVPWSGLSGWALFSHKGLRLLLPMLLLAMLAGCAIGARHSVHYRALLIAQLCIWLTSPLPLLSALRPLRWALAPQYMLLMTIALGLGAAQQILGLGRRGWDRTPRATADDVRVRR